jgi:hypothetical protein
LCASRAWSSAATKPGGVIRPFCEPAIATSTPHVSISNFMQPNEATASTISSASWSAARRASLTAAMSFTTPEAVSICATRIALMVPPLSARRRASTSLRRTARRMSPFRISTSTPIRRAFSPQPTANRPLSSTRILSPFDSTLASEASQASCPLEI